MSIVDQNRNVNRSTCTSDMPTEGKVCTMRSTLEGAWTCGHFCGTLQIQRTGAQPFGACRGAKLLRLHTGYDASLQMMLKHTVAALDLSRHTWQRCYLSARHAGWRRQP